MNPNKELPMQAHNIIQAMMIKAKSTRDDVESATLCRVANRLAHQGALFEPALTPEELRLISSFIGKNHF